MALEQELETYRPSACRQVRAQFALIQGEQAIDFFATYEDAIKAGYQKFGLEPFHVKETDARPLLITRLLGV